MKLNLILLLVMCLCVIGCKKDTDKELVDQMLKDAKDASVPVTEEQIKAMVSASSDQALKPKHDLTPLLAAFESQEFDKIHKTMFSESLSRVWTNREFNDDMQRMFSMIGDKWQPTLVESMNYTMSTGQMNGPMYMVSYELTSDFQSPFTMSMMLMDFQDTYRINHLKFHFPYPDEQIQAVKATVTDFLKSVQSQDVEKVRQLMESSFRDQINLDVLKQTAGFMWDDDNKQITFDKPHESLSDGRSVCRILVDSQIHPMMKLEVLIEQKDGRTFVVGFRTQGRIKLD